ncbi:hypothetical protein tf_23 [Pseudomonas phage tf]|jgi:hypothetical protein|uniref:Uncharacterized protein n=1 Tax=Pseudomonas phage tf TaxID=1114179 RepID=I2FLP4_9CAUD|nr:hypothetical protein tf_23 [Pseudomonas phage tf]CCE60778.1 hypothetical protein tf_23 [Pseudomonas phage tf]
MTTRTQTVIHLENTEATRKYPFTRNTLDQIQDIRYKMEKEMGADGNDYLIPAPVVIAQAIDEMHERLFP